MGRYSVNLVGESNYRDAIDILVVGERVTLLHDAGNKYDKRAVKAVDSEGSTIGYIERDSWLQRVVVDERKEVYAEVEAITGGTKGKKSKGVVLLVATAEDAQELSQIAAKRPSRLASGQGTGCAILLCAAAIGPLGLFLT